MLALVIGAPTSLSAVRAHPARIQFPRRSPVAAASGTVCMLVPSLFYVREVCASTPYFAYSGLSRILRDSTRGIAPGYFISRLQRENGALPHSRANCPSSQTRRLIYGVPVSATFFTGAEFFFTYLSYQARYRS